MPMLEEAVSFLLLAEALESHERRLLIRDQRRLLRIEMVRRVVLPLAGLALLGLAAAGVGVPRCTD